MTAVIEIASIKRRFCAYLIDRAILLMPNLLIILLLKNFPLILDLLYIFVNCSYFTYFISSATQATPGQQLMNIHTISLDGYKMNISLAFDRSISQFFLYLLKNVIIILVWLFHEQEMLVSRFSMLIVIIIVIIEQLLFLAWYLVACFSRKKQTCHDMLFDTIVVKGALNKIDKSSIYSHQ